MQEAETTEKLKLQQVSDLLVHEKGTVYKYSVNEWTRSCIDV